MHKGEEMKESTENRCRQFIKNKEVIRKEFSWESTYMYPLCAAIFTMNGKEADGGQLKACTELLRQHTGMFSNFRSTARLPIASLMAVSGNPESTISNALKVYGMLKEEFFGSAYLPLTAMVIAQMAEPFDYERIVKRTRALYKEMKSEHPLLTSSEDSSFAALLSLSERDDSTLLSEAQRCYEILKPQFFSGNAVQSLSHVLALGDGRAEEKCSRTLLLYDRLKERGYKYGTDYELPTLGVLALSESDLMEIVTEMTDTDDFLAKQKGLGNWSIGRKQRLMYTGMLVQGEYVKAGSLETAAINGTISMIVAQQAAMCAAVAASTAAAASNSSS